MDGGPKLPFGLDTDRGQGLLGARALWAGVVGPQRLAMARGSTVRLRRGVTVEVARNMGAADAVMFVGVSLQGTDDSVFFSDIASVLFGRENQLGVNSSYPTVLVQSMSNYAFFYGLTQILMPDEQLFGQLVSGLINGSPVDEIPVVVKQVQF
jgi:hypothetical protein